MTTPTQGYTVDQGKIYSDLIVDCGTTANDAEDGALTEFNFKTPAGDNVLLTDIIPVGDSQAIEVSVTDSEGLSSSEVLNITVT